MRRLVAALVVTAAMPATASTLAEWRGPSDHAPCWDRCSMAVAMDALTPERRAELVAAIRANPMGEVLEVRDGDRLGFMTYAASDGTGIDRRGFVAVLDAPEPARGWRLDGWQWVRVTGCANWTPVDGRVHAPVFAGAVLGGNETTGARVAFQSRAVAPALFAFAAGSGRIKPALFTSGATVGAWAGENPDTIPHVPLPAPFWLLAAAMGFLIALRRGAGPGRRPLGHSSLSPAGATAPALFRGRG